MRIALNLVPAAVRQRREQATRRRALVGIPIIAVAGVVGLYAVLLVDARQARDAARDYETRLTAVQPVAVRVSQLQAEIADLEQRRQALVALAGRPQLRLSPLLAEVGRLIPQDTWLQSLTIDAGTVTLTGYALELRSVARFGAGLAQSAVFEQVKVQSLQQVGAGRRTITQYQMTARLKGSGP